MKRNLRGTLSLWEFDNLAQVPNINHFVTERNSSGTGDFTLSLSSHPDKDFVRANRNKLANAIGVEPSKLFLPSQVHKTRIVNITSQTTKDELMETDALMTSERGIGIAVMSADCVPILLYDRKNHVCAAVHSGWKGTVAKILEKTLIAMQQSFSTNPLHILAGIGPSASPAVYEVGEEVISAVQTSFANADKLMVYKPQDKAMLNLWDANRFQLLEFGVPEEQIEVSNLCTILQNETFFSARKGDSGRFAAGIALK